MSMRRLGGGIGERREGHAGGAWCSDVRGGAALLVDSGVDPQEK